MTELAGSRDSNKSRYFLIIYIYIYQWAGKPTGENQPRPVLPKPDALSQLRTSQLTPLNQEKSTGKSNKKIKFYVCQLYNIQLQEKAQNRDFWVSRNPCS